MYDTPTHLARQLVRHAPKRITRLLDPAVGKGALLHPLLRRFERQNTDVVCVDTDADALNDLRERFRDRNFQSNYVNQDFLTWGIEQQSKSFDCVLMNPPFAASRIDCRILDSWHTISQTNQPAAPIPVEAAFLCLAHRLLAPSGRLLSVLPCSIVTSESLLWLRTFLLNTGSIEFVYEYPPRTFRTVDSKIYLLVFKKGTRRRSIQLISPAADRTQRLSLSLKDRVPNRLDFDFHQGRRRMQSLVRNTNLQWALLGDVASIFRGTVPSAPRPKGVVHSTDFRGGLWRRPLDETAIDATLGQIRFNDLLIRRVGRNSHLTLGIARLVAGKLATDCVFVIRPNDDIASFNLFFAIRSLMGFQWMPGFLERGTGARYFCKSSLEQLPVPLAAPTVYVHNFRRFLLSYAAECVDCASAAVSKTTECLACHCGTNCAVPSHPTCQCSRSREHVPPLNVTPRTSRSLNSQSCPLA